MLGLVKKYGTGSDREIAYENLLAEAEEASFRLADLQGGDLRLEELKSQSKEKFKELQSSAKKLSESRTTFASKLSEAITKELALLAMANAKLIVSVLQSY